MSFGAIKVALSFSRCAQPRIISKNKMKPQILILFLVIFKTTLISFYTHALPFASYDRNHANNHRQGYGQFHVTLVNPYEYQKINKNQFTLGEKFNVTLKGLGRVEKDSSATYFVVASSDEGQRFRQTLLLKAKDFHITLGFNPTDIYSERKDLNSLIKLQH